MWVKDIYNNTEYNIYVIESRRMVVATTKYEGKKVRAVARCHPEDTFDLKVGIRLAVLRCELEMYKMKRRILNNSLKGLTHNVKLWEEILCDARKEHDRILDECANAENNITDIEDLIKDILETKEIMTS